MHPRPPLEKPVAQKHDILHSASQTFKGAPIPAAHPGAPGRGRRALRRLAWKIAASFACR